MFAIFFSHYNEYLTDVISTCWYVSLSGLIYVDFSQSAIVTSDILSIFQSFTYIISAEVVSFQFPSAYVLYHDQFNVCRVPSLREKSKRLNYKVSL